MGSPLPLEAGALPCVRCGYCCSKSPCPISNWKIPEQYCLDLINNKDGTYSCAKYQSTLDSEDRSWTEISPVFGAGCCSPLNSRRRKLQ